MYRSVPAHADLGQNEREVLAFWDEHAVFQRSLEATADGPRWSVYEGPPTANGMPGTHHVEARTYKDILPRYKTMRGFHVRRRAGWDCHGLPVELAVEKALGLNGRSDIEAYGVAEFNARSDELAEVIDEHRDLILDVVSAASMVREASTSPPADDRLGLAFALDLAPPAPSVPTGTRENGSDGRGERP